MFSCARNFTCFGVDFEKGDAFSSIELGEQPRFDTMLMRRRHITDAAPTGRTIEQIKKLHAAHKKAQADKLKPKETAFDLGSFDKGVIAAAKAAHEANKKYCKSIGDDSQPTWGKAPDWQKASALAGVQFVMDNPDAGDDASHNSWMAQKEADGWVHGEVKDAETKTHPCMVPFDELPEEQQAKDALFRESVLKSLAKKPTKS